MPSKRSKATERAPHPDKLPDDDLLRLEPSRHGKGTPAPDIPDLLPFAANVTRMREAAGLSVYDLAARANMTPRSVALHEAGKPPSASAALSLAAALRTTPARLHSTGEPAPEPAWPDIPPGTREDYWAAEGKLKAAAARLARQPGTDPAMMYGWLTSRLTDLVAAFEASAAAGKFKPQG